MTDSPIMPGAQPFFARGGPLGVVVMHGFTATPHEVLWLSQHLAGQGYTVFAPRLSGHGTRPEDLARARYHDWVASAVDAVSVLRAQCQQVVVAGLSMGGCLALNVAGRLPVDGVVAMAAPTQVIGYTPSQLRWIKYLRPYTDQTDRGPFADYIAQQQAERGEPVLGRVRYGRWSTAAFEQLIRLIIETRDLLPRIRVPVLALYSRADVVVPLSHYEALRAGLTGVTRLESHIYERSGHILTQDIEKDDVFARVAAFVASLAG